MTRRPIILDDGVDKLARISSYNKRLKLIMTVFTVLGLTVASLYFSNIWNKENKAIESRLETFTELRHATLSRFVNSLAAETELWAGHESVTAEAQRYFDIWERLPAYDRGSLRGQYYGNKVNTKPSDMYAAYTSYHDKNNKTRAAFMHHHGYYDVFYFNLEGDLVYTVEKEADYGLSFDKGGQYAGTGLGQVFRAARDAKAGASIFFDFAPYAPSNGDPAAFLAAPMINERGEKIGVYAIQVPIDKFNAVLQYASGLGTSGETYVVGADHLMRNNSRLSETPTLLIKKIDKFAVKEALAGRAALATGHNTSGNKTLVAAQPLDFHGTNWAVVTEMELSELRAPLRPYIWFYLFALAFILAFGLVQYWLLKQKPS